MWINKSTIIISTQRLTIFFNKVSTLFSDHSVCFWCVVLHAIISLCKLCVREFVFRQGHCQKWSDSKCMIFKSTRFTISCIFDSFFSSKYGFFVSFLGFVCVSIGNEIWCIDWDSPILWIVYDYNLWYSIIIYGIKSVVGVVLECFWSDFGVVFEWFWSAFSKCFFPVFSKCFLWFFQVFFSDFFQVFFPNPFWLFLVFLCDFYVMFCDFLHFFVIVNVFSKKRVQLFLVALFSILFRTL